MLLNIKKVNLEIYLKGKEFVGKLQEFNICVGLLRWMRSQSKKSIGQGHLW
jgi:hypothetical protein